MSLSLDSVDSFMADLAMSFIAENKNKNLMDDGGSDDEDLPCMPSELRNTESKPVEIVPQQEEVVEEEEEEEINYQGEFETLSRDELKAQAMEFFQKEEKKANHDIVDNEAEISDDEKEEDEKAEGLTREDIAFVDFRQHITDRAVDLRIEAELKEKEKAKRREKLREQFELSEQRRQRQEESLAYVRYENEQLEKLNKNRNNLNPILSKVLDKETKRIHKSQKIEEKNSKTRDVFLKHSRPAFMNSNSPSPSILDSGTPSQLMDLVGESSSSFFSPLKEKTMVSSRRKRRKNSTNSLMTNSGFGSRSRKKQTTTAFEEDDGRNLDFSAFSFSASSPKSPTSPVSKNKSSTVFDTII
ncbi:hypothetical protein PCE1_000467 [Barthelona sp. PCE]